TASLEDAVWKRLPGRHSIGPAQPPRLAESDQRGPRPGQAGRPDVTPPPFVPPDPEALRQRSVALPEAEVASLSAFAGTTSAAVRVGPLRYSPRRGTVSYLSRARLVVRYRVEQGARAGRDYDSPYAAAADLKRLVALVENPEALEVTIRRENVEDIHILDTVLPRAEQRTTARRHDADLYPRIFPGELRVPSDAVG